MDNFCWIDCKTAKEIKKVLEDIDRKLGHLLEQNRLERQLFYKKVDEGEEDDDT